MYDTEAMCLILQRFSCVGGVAIHCVRLTLEGALLAEPNPYRSLSDTFNLILVLSTFHRWESQCMWRGSCIDAMQYTHGLLWVQQTLQSPSSSFSVARMVRFPTSIIPIILKDVIVAP